MPMPMTHGAVLISGASRGLGAVIARQLAADGWPVAVNYRSGQEQDEADGVVADILASGGTAEAFAADVTDEAAVADLVSRAVSRLGPVDAKAAQLGLARSWARELGRFGVTVNYVAPGWIPVGPAGFRGREALKLTVTSGAREARPDRAVDNPAVGGREHIPAVVRVHDHQRRRRRPPVHGRLRIATAQPRRPGAAQRGDPSRVYSSPLLTHRAGPACR
jgi:NAD(P)-dependent dehydrogenase (short-subunit alcohol dehydrogenase family)